MRLAAVLALTAGLAVPSPARADEPENKDLVLAGLAMAPASFFLGTFLHEGTHATVAWSLGAHVTSFQFWPGRHPLTGTFYFGYVSYRGRLSKGERAFFLIAPKLTNIVLFSGYSALLYTDTLPENHYGQLAFAVFATGLWVDFSKDVIAFRPQNDLVKVYNSYGYESEWSRLPLRLLHAGLSVAGAFVLYESYDRVFEDDGQTAARIVPLVQGRW